MRISTLNRHNDGNSDNDQISKSSNDKNLVIVKAIINITTLVIIILLIVIERVKMMKLQW